MHSSYEKETPRPERAKSVDITRTVSSSRANLRLKPKTIKTRRPPPPPPPESPTNSSVTFSYDLNTSIDNMNTSDAESDSEFPEMIVNSSLSADNLPSNDSTKNTSIKRVRSASEQINPRRHSLVRKLKGYFAGETGEKELTEEQKKKQQAREEKRLGKVRETALIKVYKYTTRMEKLYKKMLQKLQETMENMKSCSAGWGKEMQELQSWGVSPAVLKAREKVCSARDSVVSYYALVLASASSFISLEICPQLMRLRLVLHNPVSASLSSLFPILARPKTKNWRLFTTFESPTLLWRHNIRIPVLAIQ